MHHFFERLVLGRNAGSEVGASEDSLSLVAIYFRKSQSHY